MIRQWGGLAGITAMLLTGFAIHDERVKAGRGPIIVVDGDTVRIGKERVRLNGIDAPELPGHCRAGRNCAPGDPFAAKASLAAGFAMPGRITINRLKTDRYGRTVAQVKVGDTDLSCRQVQAGVAIYRPDWDEGHIMEGSCE